MKLDRDEIERKARACQVETEHDGEWFVPSDDDSEWLLGSSTVTTSKSPRPYATAGRVLVQANTNFPSAALLAHIAAASPPVVLALVARIRELEAFIADRAREIERVQHDADESDAVAYRAILAKGVVLP